MSAYSATPAPPARIRIVSHPPLAPLRAWLPLPTFSTRTNEPATVRDLLETIKGMLRTSDEIEIELQGFAVFENSPLSILDPTNDILDIKFGQSLRAPSPDLKPIYKNAQEGSRALPPASVPLPASSSSSSSTSSSSSSSDSDSDDEAPETLPSKRPLTASTKTASPRPSKRRKREVMTATSNLTSSDSSSSSSSSSDSSDSTSPSSDSESDSDSDSEPATKAQTPQPSDKASGTSKPTVAPGSGLKRTHKRNLRKRTLRIAKAKERNEKLGAGPSSGKEESTKEERTEPKGHGKQDEGISEGLKATAVEKGKGKELEGIDVAPSTSANTAQPSPVRKSSAKSLRDPYSDYAASLAHPTPQQQFTSPSTPTLLRDGSEPGISSVGPGRGNLPHPPPHAKKQKQKKKNNKGSQQKIEESIALAQDSPPKPSRASPSYMPASPNYSPLTPPLPTAPASGPPLSSKTKEERQFPPRFPFPNQRTNLPPWMVVTSVNVEKKGWEPGVGKRVRGTSKEWSGWNAVQARAEITSRGEDEINTKQTSETVKTMGWEDWKTREEIESAWNKLRKLEKIEDTNVGARIAVKVLELDPSTFNPTISLKYGRLLSPTPDASLRVRLHPSCQPLAEFNDDDEALYDEQGEEDGYYAEEDSEYGLKKKLKFGQDAFGDDEEKSKEETDVWEGDWTGEVRSLE